MENFEIITEKQIRVKDVLTSPVITVKDYACIPLVAQLMDHYKIGSIVVTNKQGEPLGIITEKDLVVRILTKISDGELVKRILKISPHIRRLTAGEVMTSRFIVITPDITLVEATRTMRRYNIHRLGVVSNGKLIGIISNKDILAVTPALIEILQEKKKITEIPPLDLSAQLAVTGYCEQCGNWASNLIGSNGSFLCEDCAA
ncbi:MAG: cyclic nucleotide-binding/CBS domain-containing protein [Candidatus Heimdallarchaeota archaeon]